MPFRSAPFICGTTIYKKNERGLKIYVDTPILLMYFTTEDDDMDSVPNRLSRFTVSGSTRHSSSSHASEAVPGHINHARRAMGRNGYHACCPVLLYKGEDMTKGQIQEIRKRLPTIVDRLKTDTIPERLIQEVTKWPR